jgi:hypothetical protein
MAQSVLEAMKSDAARPWIGLSVPRGEDAALMRSKRISGEQARQLRSLA